MAAPKFKTLDVRALIARGEEPRALILAAIAALQPGEGLALHAPFLPSPLVERLRAEGFTARPERQADGSWHTYFWRD